MKNLLNYIKTKKLKKPNSDCAHRSFERNLIILEKSGIPFTYNRNSKLASTKCLFRNPNEPEVDFYPETGRWRTTGDYGPRKIFSGSGGAKAFLLWYRNQTEEDKK